MHGVRTSEHPTTSPDDNRGLLFLHLAFFLPVNRICAKPQPPFSENWAGGCPLPSKHASSPVYLWEALYGDTNCCKCYPALWETSQGPRNLIEAFKGIGHCASFGCQKVLGLERKKQQTNPKSEFLTAVESQELLLPRRLEDIRRFPRKGFFFLL